MFAQFAALKSEAFGSADAIGDDLIFFKVDLKFACSEPVFGSGGIEVEDISHFAVSVREANEYISKWLIKKAVIFSGDVFGFFKVFFLIFEAIEMHSCLFCYKKVCGLWRAIDPFHEKYFFVIFFDGD